MEGVASLCHGGVDCAVLSGGSVARRRFGCGMIARFGVGFGWSMTCSGACGRVCLVSDGAAGDQGVTRVRSVRFGSCWWSDLVPSEIDGPLFHWLGGRFLAVFGSSGALMVAVPSRWGSGDPGHKRSCRVIEKRELVLGFCWSDRFVFTSGLLPK